ncbi:MAG: hypothetical protein M1824_004281 [Vezdaea acicularis]|nr:MAG: hypothetical protein M1824_004281 [Vezdaea acicularis]
MSLRKTLYNLLPILLALPGALASPVSTRAAGITTAQLLAIAPTSGTCAGAPFPAECSTADHAVPFINGALITYGITSPYEQAAIISTMAFESGDFKYNRNHYPAPGRPGQGTRNMQMSTYNLAYAKSIPALAGPLAQVAATDLNGVLALVMADQYSFGSAAWFLTSQCGAGVRQGLQSGTQAGWQTYVSSCIGTTVTSDRMAYWTRAVQALAGQEGGMNGLEGGMGG